MVRWMMVVWLVVSFCGSGDEAQAIERQFNLMVPMRDGVRLSTDVYRPDGRGKFPTLLIRSPYGNGSEPAETRRAEFFASQDYVFVFQDCRGRYDSEGKYYPFVFEANDGFDTLAWIAAQPWSDGQVAMYGVSYLAYLQWMTAVEQSPHLRSIIPAFSPLDLYRDTHPGGAYELTRIAWAALMDGRTNQRFPFDWDSILRHLPFLELDRVAGMDLRFWQDTVEHPSYDRYWEEFNPHDRIAAISCSVLQIGGWYDIFLSSTFHAYQTLKSAEVEGSGGRSHRLLIGPWSHARPQRESGILDFGPEAEVDLDRVVLRWLDHELKGIDNGLEQEAPLRIFVMGANRWRNARRWPLAGTSATKYYLHSGGNARGLRGDGFLDTVPPGPEAPDRYRYDPLDPVPTRGGNLPGASPGLAPGPFDHREIEERDDVLVYSTAPLAADTEVTGPVRVVLHASSTATDTDFTAKLLDVHPDGRAINLADGIVRARYRNSRTHPEPIEPGAVLRYEIDLVAISNLFRQGHRIRIEISSSNFPRFSRNLNTGAPLGKTRITKIAEQTVYHDAGRPSHIVLPLVPIE